MDEKFSNRLEKLSENYFIRLRHAVVVFMTRSEIFALDELTYFGLRTKQVSFRAKNCHKGGLKIEEKLFCDGRLADTAFVEENEIFDIFQLLRVTQ